MRLRIYFFRGKKRIRLFSTPTAVEFYKANNFSESGTACSEMHYDA